MKNKGLALMVTLAFIVITTIVAGTYLALTSSQTRFSEFQFRRNLANYASNAGLQYGLELLRLDPTASPSYLPGQAYCITGASTCPGRCTVGGASCLLTNVPDLQLIENNIPFNVSIRIGAVGENPSFIFSRPLASLVEYSLVY